MQGELGLDTPIAVDVPADMVVIGMAQIKEGGGSHVDFAQCTRHKGSCKCAIAWLYVYTLAYHTMTGTHVHGTSSLLGEGVLDAHQP